MKEEEIILELYKEIMQLKIKAETNWFKIENINLKRNYINTTSIINSVSLWWIKININ